MTTDTPEWSAVEENMALITGIEKAVRQLVNTLPAQIRDALGWVTMKDTPEAIARSSIGMYQEFRDGGYEPQEALECAVIEVLGGLDVDLDAIRAEMATQPQLSALDSADWTY